MDLFQNIGFKIEKCANLVQDIRKEESEILKLFSSRNRDTIRYAQKLGVQVEIFRGQSPIPYLKDYCRVQGKLFENKKNTYSDIYSKSEIFLMKILNSTYNKTYISLAYFENKPAAGVIYVGYEKILSWYSGVSDYQLVKTSKASNLLDLEVIKFAKANGYLYYDFGSIPFSSDPSISTHSVYLFKKSFGGERFEYDEGIHILRKSRYWLINEVIKLQNNRLIRFVYKLLK